MHPFFHQVQKKKNKIFDIDTRKFLCFFLYIVQNNGEILNLLGDAKTTLTAYSRSSRFRQQIFLLNYSLGTFPLPLFCTADRGITLPFLALRCFPSPAAYFYHQILKHDSCLIMPQGSFK
jgi:hypothetical protein